MLRGILILSVHQTPLSLENIIMLERTVELIFRVDIVVDILV
jgi:hypothetical protein